MRIIHIIKQFHPSVGGIETRLYDLCKAADDCKDIDEVLVITTRLKNTKKEEKYFKKTRVLRIGVPTDYVYDKKIIIGLKNLFRDQFLYASLRKNLTKDTIIHVHGPWAAPVYTRPAKKFFSHFRFFRPWTLFDCPCVMHYDYEPPVDKNWVESVDEKTCDAVIYVDNFEKPKISKNKLYYIPNSVDTDFLRYDGSKREYVSYIGRISKEKGWDTFVDSVDGLDAKTMVVGKGQDEDDLKKRFKGEFVGSVENSKIIPYYSKSIAVAVPLRIKGISRIVLEAMSCGCIVLKSDIDPTPIKDGFNGFTFRHEDTEDLKEKIKMVFALDEKNLKEISKNARETVKTEYDNKLLSEKIFDIYCKILK